MSLNRIALAEEADFDLGPWQVRPGLGVMCLDDHVEKVEPRVLQALIVLKQAEGRTVSRDELMRRAWGVVVSEDAVGRAIARLRTVLGQGGGIGIETIPKIGYRLTGLPDPVPVGPAPEIPAAAPPLPAGADTGRNGTALAAPPDILPPEPRRPASLRTWAAGALGLAVLSAAVVALTGRDAGDPPDFDRVRPVTADVGREIDPALAPGGGLLAYAARAPGSDRLSLWLTGVDGGAPIRLTEGEADDLAPAWSPDGSRLAFLRTDGRSPCRLVVKPVPAGTEREVGRCLTDSWTSPTWAGPDALLFVDRPAPGTPARIVRLSLADGTRTDVTAPPDGITGDFFPRLSPDGQRLAFSRRVAPGLEDVHVLTLADGRVTPLTRDRRKLHGLGWSGDGASVIVASNRVGDFALWRIPADGTGAPARLAPGLGRLGGLSAAGDRIAAEVDRSRTALVAVRPGADPAPAVPASTGRDWAAAVAGDGTVAYVSDRSGGFDVWLVEPGGVPRRLTDLRGPLPDTPVWAPDGRRLAFSATAEGGADILVADRDGGPLVTAVGDPADDRAPSWAADGTSLLFASNRGGAWRIWRTAPPFTTAEPVTDPGWVRAVESADGRWLYLGREGQAGVWRLPLTDGAPAPGAAPERVSDAPAAWDTDGWTLDGTAVLLIRRPADGPPELVRLDPDSGEVRTIAAVPGQMGKSGLAVAPDGAVILAVQTSQESDIVLIEPAAR